MPLLSLLCGVSCSLNDAECADNCHVVVVIWHKCQIA